MAGWLDLPNGARSLASSRSHDRRSWRALAPARRTDGPLSPPWLVARGTGSITARASGDSALNALSRVWLSLADGPEPKSRARSSGRLAIHLDGANIFVRRLRLRQGNRQHAVPEGCGRVVTVDALGQSDTAFKAAVAALGIATILVFDLGALLATKRQRPVFDGDFDVLLVEARQFGRDADFLVGLAELDMRLAGSAVEPG